MEALADEREAWTDTCRLLRQHGLPPVAPLSDEFQQHSHTDYIVFELDASRRLRDNLTSLMSDVTRRQQLVQELIQTNNQLREELSAQATVSERYESRARDLRAMLDNSKAKVQALEVEMQDATFTKSRDENENEAAQNTLRVARAQVRQLETRCLSAEQEVARLQKELDRIAEADSKRVAKQQHAMAQLRKHSAKTRLDDKFLDVIESYERQIAELQSRLDDSSPEISSPEQGTGRVPGMPDKSTPQYKELIKSYEKEVRESRRRVRALENDVSLLQLELQSRPEVSDLMQCQSKLQKLQRVVKQHRLGGDDKKGPGLERKYSTLAEDIDFLPLTHCRHHLKAVCEALGVADLRQTVEVATTVSRDRTARPRLQQFVTEVLSLVSTEDVTRPAGLEASYESCNETGREHGGGHEIWCEKSWHHALPTLRHWRQQLLALTELEQSVKLLRINVCPWLDRPTNKAEPKLTPPPPTVERLVAQVTDLVKETHDDGTHNNNKHSAKKLDDEAGQSSRSVLQAVVTHFMTLFDVAKVTGCYARMNDVYAKLGETHNVLKTLRQLLGLDRDVRSSALVDMVARLVQLQDSQAHVQLDQLLPGEDATSITRKMQLHDQFFPAFHDIMKQLMEDTGVSRIDQVVPAVRALKLLSDSKLVQSGSNIQETGLNRI